MVLHGREGEILDSFMKFICLLNWIELINHVRNGFNWKKEKEKLMKFHVYFREAKKEGRSDRAGMSMSATKRTD